MSRIVIALGGNALGDTPAEQRDRIAAAAPALVGLIAQGHEIIVSHGNGPQVGAIHLAFDVASSSTDRVPSMPLPECTAMSQGYIGYHLQQGILAELRRVGMPWHVASVVTQVEVDPHDPAFDRPSKPIGGFYDEPTARELMARDPQLRMVEDAGRGWRVVVPSPQPVDIVERDSILNLLDHEFVVIACGGGGVPVVRGADGSLQGVPAVIDKDFASAALAEAVGADYLFILTAVDGVAIGFGTPDQRDLDELDLATAQRYVDEGQFGAGSMLPKVQAAMRFAASGPGRRAVICSLDKAPLAMQGLSGTVVRGVEVPAAALPVEVASPH
ncbi:carbamate kinase [Isoptericola sp. b490]|uniref:carbamate kinase n=1 Tax=Actinotalea lenta TaxID=3064654 RepID=UPI0027132483|nr:carbamate kinase [Isoptericola sp. b490]MDO8119842.1 carbamate kinase [Isoptericola sp. b490]